MIVIIDNYDSFTYNLYQYYNQMDDDVQVYRNDEISIEQVQAMNADLIVLSPGPGTPEQANFSKEIIRVFQGKIPVLGICLGHQVIIEFFGGKVIKGNQPMHGKVTPIEHDGKTTFKHVPTPTSVTRYHSLVAREKSMPACLEVSARSNDHAIMAVRHKSYPIEGIQFHPESILTKSGFLMLKNNYKLALQWKHEQVGRKV